MTHSEEAPLNECIEKWKRFDQHEKESVPIRDSVKKHELEIDIIKEQIRVMLPKVQNMTIEVLKAGIIGGLVGNLIGEGIKSVVLEIVKLVVK